MYLLQNHLQVLQSSSYSYDLESENNVEVNEDVKHRYSIRGFVAL